MHLFNKLLGKTTVSKGVVGLSFTPEGIAIAISSQSGQQKPILTHCEFIHSNNKQQDLKDLTVKYQLTEYDCHLVLGADDYRLISIEQPAVAEEELAEAIRWKVSDLVDFSIDDAIIDYYTLPKPGRENSQKMLDIIASPISAIQPLVDLCSHCDLQLQVIDIQETSLRNLATLLPENDRGIAVLHLQKSSGQITIEQQGAIYLNRKLAIGFERLGLSDSFLSDEQIAMEQGGLALDIQRSFDYLESYYGLPPLSDLAVIPLTDNTQGLLNFLNSNYGITARIMDLSTIIDGDILLDDTTQSLCATVIGTTLRNSLKANDTAS